MNFIKYLIVTLIAVSCISTATSAEVDTITVYSQAMKKDVKVVVIKPAQDSHSSPMPVVYLLHGYSGNHSNWVLNAPELQAFSDQYNILFVCPDGGYNSWYMDSSVNPAVRYETHIVKEVVSWIDAHYPTIADRSGRAITGFSMGGHGALYLAIRNQDVFGAAGSLSGAADIRPFPDNWELASLLGSITDRPANWDATSVHELTASLRPDALALIIDCGTEDFFFGVNEALHQQLRARHIPHTYITMPGGHDWDYWRTATTYQLDFFRNWFNKGRNINE